MSKEENIEKLFKDRFEHFEADVSPKAWSNIQSGLHAASGGSAGVSGGIVSAGKIAAVVISAAVISGSVWYFSDSTKPVSDRIQKPSAIEQLNRQAEPNENEKNNLPGSEIEKPLLTTLNNTQPISAEQQAVIDKKDERSEGTTLKDISSGTESNSNIPTSSTPKSRYGNATKGDGGMMRRNPAANAGAPGNQNNETNEPDENNLATPTAAIFASCLSGDVPLQVDFLNQGIGASLAWDFGDGKTSNEIGPTHTFEKPGTYTVKLISKNQNESASDKITIEVKPISSITNIPNIFTPNADGINDNFYFEIKNISSIGVAIYSQADGMLVCTWNSLDGSWNGKLMNGLNAPPGVYLYSIQANGVDGIVHSKRGFVTLSVK